ncbi:hypothetical protein ACIRPU_08015 [Streptomyces sp. NPDC102259]
MHSGVCVVKVAAAATSWAPRSGADAAADRMTCPLMCDPVEF